MMTIAVFSHRPRFVPSACLLAFCVASATSDLTAEDAVSPSLGVEDVLSMRNSCAASSARSGLR
jgi:hypothetical protein